MTPIKTLADFHAATPFTYRGVLTTCATIAGVVIALATRALADYASTLVPLITILGLARFLFVVTSEAHYRNERTREYEDYLATIDRTTLEVFALSPETDQESRQIMVRILTAVSPGWSYRHIQAPVSPA